MPDEKKIYLINIESNIKKYAEEAAEAKKKVDELKASNDALKKSGTASAAEMEANNAALKNATAEYTKAQKMVQLQIAANKSEAGSRKQLGEILKLQEQELGKLGKAYITNAQGIRTLNPLYIEQRNKIAATKKAIIDYDLALNDGRSNIGRYGEAVSAAMKGAGQSILSMISPMALVAVAVAAAKKIFEGLKDAIMSTTFGMDLAAKSGAVLKQMFYDIAINGKLSMETLISASKIQGELNALRIRGGFEILQLSKINREEQAIREQSIDRTKTHAERLVLLNRVIDLESQKTKIEVEHLTDELKAKEKLLKQQPENEKLMLNIIALRAKINDTYAEEDQVMRRVQTQRTGFIQEEIDNRKKLTEAWYKEIDDQNKANEDAAKKKHDQEVTAEKAAQDFVDKEVGRMDKEAEDKWNKEVELQRKIYESNRKAGQSEYDARIEEEKALAEAVLQIHETLNDSKINLTLSAINFLSAIAGRNKSLQNAFLIADRAFAIAEVVIQTTKANATIRALAAASVLPGPGYLIRLGASMTAAMIAINLNRVAAAIDIAAIIAATVAGIAGNAKSGISGGGGGGGFGNEYPTSISSSPPAQRTFATATGSSVLTQPQLSQSQLNALPNQNLLTAQEIANAISKLPAPIVTVEDINAKTESKRKVEVRANI